MTSKTLPPFQPLLAVRLDEMIGRDAEVQQFLKACEELRDPASYAHLFYIYAKGGIGKTRFLEDVRDQEDRRFKAEMEGFLCTDIIDLYDPDTHSRTELIARIAQSLCSRYPEIALPCFESFWKEIYRYRTQQANLVIDTQIREIVHDAFQVSLNTLSQRYPILILLDTAEVLHFDEDEIQTRIGVSPIAVTSLEWIRACVENMGLCRRTLFVVAGRPSPDKLREEFLRLSKHTIYDNNPNLRSIEFRELSEPAAASYFDALSTMLSKEGYAELSNKVRGIPQSDRERLRELADGSPVTLALTIHFWLTEHRSKIRALMEQPGIDRNARLRQLRQILVNALGHFTFGEITEPLHFVALLRRGMRLSDLRELWTNASERDCEDAFEFLKHMSFIKTRTEDGVNPENGDLIEEDVLYMHDEIADWIEDGFFATEPGYPRQLRQRIVEVLKERNKKLEHLIQSASQISDELEELRTARQSLETAGRYVYESAEDKTARDIVLGDERERVGRREITSKEQAQDERHQAARRERRRVQTALMHYGLRADPRFGYDRYFELSEEVFASKQYEIDTRVRAEFLLWWNAELSLDGGYRNRLHANEAGLNEDWINSDLAYRWVQRIYNKDQQYGTAEMLGVAERAKRQVNLHPIFDAGVDLYHLSVTGAGARAQVQVDATLEGFGECIQKLETAQNSAGDNSPQHTVATAVLGSAYYGRGYFSQNFDPLDQAITDCARSAFLFRDLGYEADQARALNSKAYYLALSGDPQTALIFAVDALLLRQKLGYGLPIAFSENTLASILVLADRPQSALYFVRHALTIFRKLESRFGEYLALRTRAEVFRRYAESIPQSLADKKRGLENACQFAEQALNIARDIKSGVGVSQMADCIGEYASAHRDLGKFCKDYPNDCGPSETPDSNFTRASNSFNELLASLPEGVAYNLRRVEGLVDLAYSQSYQGQANAALDKLDEALSYVPDNYKVFATAQHNSNRSQYWWQLSKASALRIMLAGSAGDSDALIKASIEGLLYSNKITGAPRPKRRTREVMYEAYKGKTSKQLLELAEHASKVSQDMGIGDHRNTPPIRQYFEEFFGV